MVGVVGVHVRARASGEGPRAKISKTEPLGSVSGVPCQTAMEGNIVRWWGGVEVVVGVVGVRVRACKREEGARAKKSKTEPLGSVFGWMRDAGGAVGLCGATAPPAALT